MKITFVKWFQETSLDGRAMVRLKQRDIGLSVDRVSSDYLYDLSKWVFVGPMTSPMPLPCKD
jgi:hypothetical protein